MVAAGSDQLDYVLRIRDLVHGYVYLTEPEVQVVNHPLFQRLRHIRQNDVAFFVYPSLNISRFEHSVGCAHVAGKMAANLLRSSDWHIYQKTVELGPSEFIQLCRLYALLHDVGHLPLSHLFETAFKDHEFSNGNTSLVDSCKRWFAVDGFAKLHEACGAALAPEILDSVELRENIKSKVQTLLCTKKIPRSDPLHPIKLIVDSEIDADRIDATARDGLLAGQEYGNYDIERLCSSVFLQNRKSYWRLAYSHKTLGSIEALLTDRYKTHTWIHFHHRVVCLKVATAFLISGLLHNGTISHKEFPVKDHKTMTLRDDVWLWSKLRDMHSTSPKLPDPNIQQCCLDAVLFRKNGGITPLWKNRVEYQEVTAWLTQKLERAALAHEINPQRFGPRYEQYISRKLDIPAVLYWCKFKPIDRDYPIPLTDDKKGVTEEGHLLASSPVTNGLRDIWDAEPQFYVVLLGEYSGAKKDLIRKWVEVTFNWMDSEAGKV